MGITGGAATLVQSVRLFDEAGVAISDLAVRRPSLDDVFLTLTGHVATDDQPEAPAGKGRTARRNA
jgi:ABC-2 type transport system ATP-binding protein